MRRKVLQGYVNTFSGMFEGWRAYEDQETLLELSQEQPTTLKINVLTGECSANGTAISPLYVASEMHTWFHAQLARNDIPMSAIAEAELTVKYQAKLWLVPVGKKPFPQRVAAVLTGKPTVYFYRELDADFDCRAIIRTSDYEYLSLNGKRGDSRIRQD
jgi:hypothetical protein